MQASVRLRARSLIAIVAIIFVAPTCKLVNKDAGGAPSATTTEPAAAPSAVAAYTTGAISKTSVIRVQFSDSIVGADRIGQSLEDSPFDIDPEIEGVAVWDSAAELQFRPAQALPAGSTYKVELDLGDVLPDSHGTLEFSFAVMEQSFELSVGGLQAADPKELANQQFSGAVLTADVAAGADVEKTLAAKHGDDELSFTWSHSDDGRRHNFVITGIVRREEASPLEIELAGASLGVDRKLARTIQVPGLNSFEVSDARAIQGDQTYIELRFTDPLKRKQNLAGLITIALEKKLRFAVDGSIVRIYSSQPWSSSETVQVAPGIRNVLGYKLRTKQALSVSFESLEPAVKFAGKGVILPTSQGLTVPIEVANLRAVVVEATRVHDHNLPQFLQVNNLGGDNELQRVGRVVWRRTVDLGAAADKMNRWVRYGLDVSALVHDNPNGLYRLELTFDRRHINYPCSGNAPAALVEDPTAQDLDNWDVDATESSYWDSYQGEEGMGYWELHENRNDPCHPGYYREFADHNVTVSRNILVSDIGVIAKYGTDGSLFIATTDIKTAQPLSGTKVTVLDFQQQRLAGGVTDGEGILRVADVGRRKPFVVLAEYAGQAGVLRLDDGEALAVGHFDVGGARVSKGLKGFFYGERGIWRPGDDIFLTFILLDRNGTIPGDHPVRFELRNARGQIVDNITKRTSVSGFYTFPTKTDPDAPTGDYTARVRVGGATFERILKIETVVPNRLEIDFDFGTNMLKAPDARVDSTLSAMWLHGAIAGNLQTTVEVTLLPRVTHFPEYEEYTFDDPTRDYHPQSEEIFSGRLDDKGETEVISDIDPGGKPPGMLTAAFTTRVFEPSGAFSVDRHTIPFAPYKRFVGIRTPKGDKARGMLLTDTKHEVRIVAVNADGKPTGAGKVKVKLYKIRWRWWWEKGSESLASYVGSSGYTPIETGTVKLKNGAGKWEFEIKYPAWGRYLITAVDQEGKHRSGKIIYVDWPGWAGRAQKDQPGGASVLTFTADKREYAVGDEVSLSIPTANEGRALVSIESGSRVLQASWLTPTGKVTPYVFPATAAMAPNVYAHVTFLQPHLTANNDMPIRMYGVVPIKVFDPHSRLAPVIESAEVFEPNATSRVRIREAKGRAMTYTLAVVDQGLLGLTRFATPDPWAHFFRREALAVKTWDVFDDVAGAYGGSLETLLAIGGDEEGDAGGTASKANRFEPMVRFYGPFQIGAGETGEHDVDIGQYIGAVRLMVVAGQDGAFGKADKSVFVRKPLMVLATLPRVLGPEERVDLPLAIFALDEKVKKVEVTVTVSGPLKITGKASKWVKFKTPGDEIVTFPLAVKDALGVGKVFIKATGAGESAEQTIEIDVRHPGGRVVDVLARTLQKGESWSDEVTLPGIAGTNRATLEVSRVPPINLGKRLDYLIGYPHGCVEQTVSRAFPQVYLSKLLDLSPQQETEVEKYVKAGIEKMRGFQNSGGGFGYWPGESRADDWSTSYAGHFLLEAQQAGYRLPTGMVSQWKKYQRQSARRAASGERSDLVQAYRLYTLALAGSADLPSMNRLKEGEISSPARWRLAAAYQLAGQPETAKALARGQSVKVAAYTELSNTFGSDLRDQAMILETLVLIKESRDVPELVEEISKALASERSLSTQSTAYALIAMARFLAANPPTGDAKASYSWSGAKSIALAGDNNKPLASIDLSTQQPKNALTLTNSGSETLFARLVLSGLPKVGTEESANNGLAVDVAYSVPDGGAGGTGDAIDPTSIDQGTDFVARVTVRNTSSRGKIDQIALSQMVAAGWEIHNARLDPARARAGGAFDYRDIRDDRVYTYFDLGQGESRTFAISLNAAYLGKFYLPPVSATAMYDETINGREAGEWVAVRKPGPRG